MSVLHPVLLLLHVSLGTIALFAGTVALIVRKGDHLHRRAGLVFALGMGASSFLGAVLGLIDYENFYITFHAGLLGLTLILSSWFSVKQSTRLRGHFMTGLGALNLMNLIGLVTGGQIALASPDGALLGFAAENYFFLAGMTGVAAAGDISLWFRQGVSDRHRIARHLWRMCLGFFIAAGSAFTGPGAVIFPEPVQESGLLSLPELLIFLAMVIWLIRVWWKGRPGRKQESALPT